MSSYDIAIIGGGPGGYVAAIRAAQLGLNAVVIERDKLGGICLNWGCIPTKALLRSSEVFTLFQEASHFGLSAPENGFDFEKIIARSRKVSSQLSNGIGYLMKKNKITVVQGTAKLKDKGQISVTDANGTALEDIEAKNIIIATGARAKVIPGLETDGEVYLGLPRRARAQRITQIIIGCRLRRHRYGICQFLSLIGQPSSCCRNR